MPGGGGRRPLPRLRRVSRSVPCRPSTPCLRAGFPTSKPASRNPPRDTTAISTRTTSRLPSGTKRRTASRRTRRKKSSTVARCSPTSPRGTLSPSCAPFSGTAKPSAAFPRPIRPFGFPFGRQRKKIRCSRTKSGGPCKAVSSTTEATWRPASHWPSSWGSARGKSARSGKRTSTSPKVFSISGTPSSGWAAAPGRPKSGSARRNPKSPTAPCLSRPPAAETGNRLRKTK